VRRAPTAAGLVILDSGWTGEDVLVRLLSAGGQIDVRGHALARTVARPARHLRRSLDDRDGRVPAALVQPHHLWLVNSVDPWEFVADLQSDRFLVVSLHRASGVDRGISRALCGPEREVLPSEPRLLDPGAVAVYGRENDLAAGWFEEVVATASHRFELERDLITAEARAATVSTICSALGLEAWPAPPEREIPGGEVLRALVANHEQLLHGLAIIAGGDDG
jgi:hypothetical protein